MKVTKIIREYVEEKINAKYQPALDAVEAKYKDENNEYNEKLVATQQLMEATVREEFRKLFAEYFPNEALEEMVPENLKKGRNWVTTPYCYSYSPKFREAQNEELSAIRTKRDKAIKNVLIGLELGGTKKDLDRLLEEALAEEV